MSVKIWMVFEALGPNKEGVEESINEHIEALKSEDGVEVQSIEEDETEKMEDPHPDLSEGYSKVLEVNVEFDDFYKAMEAVINYGPTYIQMEGPDSYKMDLSEAQDSLQKMATTMHQYAQMGAGGVLISQKSSDES